MQIRLWIFNTYSTDLLTPVWKFNGPHSQLVKASATARSTAEVTARKKALYFKRKVIGEFVKSKINLCCFTASCDTVVILMSKQIFIFNTHFRRRDDIPSYQDRGMFIHLFFITCYGTREKKRHNNLFMALMDKVKLNYEFVAATCETTSADVSVCWSMFAYSRVCVCSIKMCLTWHW